MSKLTAFLITRNEEADIAACLRSLQGLADEIIIVDDHSTDSTVAHCRALGAKVFTRSLDGFASQKQFALEQCTGEWAFSIDADERLSGELVKSILALLKDSNSAEGYWIQRNFYFLGKRLRYGGVGRDKVLRLFKRTQGRFQGGSVHEHVDVLGETGMLEGTLEHYSYASLQEYLEKANHYTSLAAKDLWAEGRRWSPLDYLRPSWELFLRVVIKGAWLDGGLGLMYAGLSSHTAWVRSMKLWEIQQARGEMETGRQPLATREKTL